MSDKPERKVKLSASQEQILRDQTITDTEPGSILHDFRSMLRYVQANDLALSTTGLLPMKSLRPLNEAMHRPLEVGLTRPRLRSLPNIEGLSMLLRASGLTRVEYKGKKRLLRADASALAGWEQLNDVEQYVQLLRTWLLWADPEVIREGTSSSQPMIAECLAFVAELPCLLKRYRGDVMDHLRYLPHYFNVALAEMFGLVVTDQKRARKGEGWTVTRIRVTPFGQSLSALLIPMAGAPLRFFTVDDEVYAFEHWQQHLLPFFPDLQQEFLCPEDEPVEGVHVITVSLVDCWRQFAVPHTCAMESLAGTILDAVEFDHEHLYEFTVEDRFGTLQKINHYAMEESPYADETTIGELCLQPGQYILFHYDFGDDWEFGITVDRIDPPDHEMQQPQLVKAHGEPPKQYRYLNGDEW